MQRQITGATLAVAGFVLAVVQAVHAAQRTATSVGFAIDAVPFALMAVTVSYAGFWLVRDETLGDHAPIVGAWVAGSAIAFASVSALILTGLNVGTDAFPLVETAPYVAIDNITAGALAGVLVGLYDAMSRASRDELERQRDRVETFANRAADLNAYGRALNQSTTLEEVSALCVEAVEMLVDYHQTAVVELRGDAATLVESTIVDADDGTVAALAAATEGSEAGVQDLEPTEGLPEGVASALGVTVIETDGASVVLVALDRDGESLTEETRSLLELLASHAATALSNSYQADADSEENVYIELESGVEESQ